MGHAPTHPFPVASPDPNLTLTQTLGRGGTWLATEQSHSIAYSTILRTVVEPAKNCQKIVNPPVPPQQVCSALTPPFRSILRDPGTDHGPENSPPVVVFFSFWTHQTGSLDCASVHSSLCYGNILIFLAVNSFILAVAVLSLGGAFSHRFLCLENSGRILCLVESVLHSSLEIGQRDEFGTPNRSLTLSLLRPLTPDRLATESVNSIGAKSVLAELWGHPRCKNL